MARLNVSELLRAMQVVERNVTVSLMYSGLRLAQYRLLELVQQRGQITVSEASEALRITRATASVQVNESIRGGIIAVVENERDRRSFHVQLTELGKNKLNVARSDLSVMQDKLSRHYSEEIVSALNDFAEQTKN